MTELQFKIWEQATQGDNPQTRVSLNRGEVVEAMGFEWSGDPLGTKPKEKPVPAPKPAPPPVEDAPEPAPAPVVSAQAPVAAPAPAPVEVARQPEPEPAAPVVAEATSPEAQPEPVAVEPEAPAVEPDPTPDDPNPKPDATPITELGLTAGVVAALSAAGLATAGDVRAQETAGTLADLPGIGPAKLASIRAALA